MSELVWSFETKNFRIECLFSPDDYVDASFDETGETAENINSGLWQAFNTEIRIIHLPTDTKLGSDYLGGSIYEKPLDFIREHYGCKTKGYGSLGYGSYFTDMVRQAIADARKQMQSLKSTPLHT